MRLKEKLSSWLGKEPLPWKKPNGKSDTATPFCRVCFKDIHTLTYGVVFSDDPVICPKCFQSMEPEQETFKVDGIKAMSLYPYEEGFRSQLYALKGAKDIELAPTFLYFQKSILRALYLGYTIVPAPSYIGHDQARGFNHVVELFRPLGLEMLELLDKTSDHKQADSTIEERSKVKDVIVLKKKIDLSGKKILFVDDVFTTGATAKACLALIASCHPKRIKALFLAKTAKPI